MDFISFITLISAVFCSKNSPINILKEINKNTFDLKVVETNEDFIFAIKSPDYLPLFGSWHSNNTLIAYEHLFIDEEYVYEWLHKNITDFEKLSDFFNNLGNITFEFKIVKRHCEENNHNFEFRAEVVKKNDLKNILFDYYLKGFFSIDTSNEYFKGNGLVEVATTIVKKEITCSFRFANNSCEMPDFNNYEFVAYELVMDSNNKKMNSETELDRFKQTLINIGKHTLVGLAIFGPYALILHFLMAKYLIK